MVTMIFLYFMFFSLSRAQH